MLQKVNLLVTIDLQDVYALEFTGKILADVNSYYDFSQWQKLGFDIPSLHADPMFTNPEQGEF